MLFRPAWVSALSLLAVATAHADWWSEYIASRVSISGYRNIGIHFDQISGDGEAYGQSNYGGLGGNRITDLGYLRIEGRKVADLFNFDLNIQDNRFQDPQADNVSLGLTKGNWALGLGDIQGSVGAGNEFIGFSRKLKGASVGYHAGKISINALRSEARGAPRSVSIPGNNTPGPYYLQSNQIVRGSERIAVDGVVQKFGEDYTIDYDLGSIVFENRASGTSKVISPASTIVASYESFGFGGPSGLVEGASVELDAGKFGRFGVTGVRQTSSFGTQSSTRLEQFQGFGPPTVPYTLQFAPQANSPVTIRVDGVVQVQNLDFRFDTINTSVFFINRFVATTSTVDVLYTPTSNNDIQGDRTGWGVDWTANVGNSGTLKLTQAVGSLSNSTTPRSGQARGLNFSYGFDKFKVNTDLRSVDDDFVSVQSAGFNRNEKSAQVGIAYAPNERQSWDLSWLNSSVASTVGTAVSRGRQTTTGLSHVVTTTSPDRLPLTFNFQRTESSTGLNNSIADTASLSTRYESGKWGTSVGLSNSRVGGDSEGNVTSFNTTTRYAAAKKLWFSLGANLSQIKSGSATGVGRDLSLSASYTPSEHLTARATLADSDAGSISSIAGFNSGFGLGVGGNGFTGSPESVTPYSAASGRRIQFDLEAKPGDRTVLGVSVFTNLARGSVTSNAQTQGLNAYGTFDASEAMRIQGAVGLTRTSYDGSDAVPISTTFNLDVDGNLGRKWSYATKLSALMASGNTGFDQSNALYDASLTYALADRQALSLNFSGSKSSGYLPQNETDWSLAYRYQLWKTLGLSLAYRDHRVINLDPTVTTGAYHSNGLHLELAFGFSK